MVVKTGVKVARAQVQQDGGRNGAIVIQPRCPGGNKCAAISTDLSRQAIRVPQEERKSGFRYCSATNRTTACPCR